MRRIRSNYVLQVHKVTSGEVVHNFSNDSWFLCHVATWTSHVATSFLTLSATSRRGPTRRDVKITCSVTSRRGLFTSRRQFVQASVTSRRVFSHRDVNLHKPLSRRDVVPHVATSFLHVSVTSRRGIPTSRRGLNPRSVTSRRCLKRRDVA